MEQFNIIIPILNKSFLLNEKQKELNRLLSSYEENYEFTVFFVASSAFQKPENYENLKNSELVLTKLNNANDLITIGFEKITHGASIILNLEDPNALQFLQELLKEKTESNVVKLKYIPKKQNKFVKKVKQILVRFYYRILLFFGLEKDLLCSSECQYFNASVTKVIKTMPEKNAYLRNFNALVGYEQKILTQSVKKEVFLNKKDSSVILSFMGTVLGLLFFMSTLIFTKQILGLTNGFILYLLLLGISAILVLFSIYVIAKTLIKLRANL